MAPSLPMLTHAQVGFQPGDRPIRILQFGEGNFLRAFVDWMIQRMNDRAAFQSGVALVQPIPFGRVGDLMQQDGLYHVLIRGIEDGKAIERIEQIDVIQQGINPYEDFGALLKLAASEDLRFVISNTTEAGIAYQSEGKPSSGISPESFPAKVCALLHHRFQELGKTEAPGLIFLPCELINKNGEKLAEIVQRIAKEWGLDAAFLQWINTNNIFCNTLVDRIVPGYPREEIGEIHQKLGVQDHSVVVGEAFHLWVIEGPEEVRKEFPADQAGLNVIFTEDQLANYRTRKVRILNGAHTLMVPIGILAGIETVREAVEHESLSTFLQKAISEEIIPTLDLPQAELSSFAEEVMDRFRNPFIRHELASIALNSVSKYKTRVLPSLLSYQAKEQELPYRLTLGLAALIFFYSGAYQGRRLPVNDSHATQEFFSLNWHRYRKQILTLEEMVEEILGEREFWGIDLHAIPDLTILITDALEEMLNGRILRMVEELS